MNIIALCSDQNMLIVRIYEGCKDDERKISEGQAEDGKTIERDVLWREDASTFIIMCQNANFLLF